METKLDLSATAKGRGSLKGVHTHEVLRLHPVLFTLIVVIAIASPFLGLVLNGWAGVAVGLAVNIVALLLGLKAVQLIVRETHFRA
jgi:hypothetical protein